MPLSRDRKAPRGKLVQTEVWEWHGMGEDQGDEAARWLSAYLGRPVRLLRYAGELLVVSCQAPCMTQPPVTERCSPLSV